MSGASGYRITIIGSGRVASNLAHAFHKKGISINEIYSRTIERARLLSNQIPTSIPTSSLDFRTSRSNIFIVAVNDRAIGELAQSIKLPAHAQIFHTSGTVSMKVLSDFDPQGGIFYPLQTFTYSRKFDFKEIPILVEAASPNTLEVAVQLGSMISSQVHKVQESDRQHLHLAAVFASNFTNRMLAAAQEILKTPGLDFELLKPLVRQSVSNAFEEGPNQSLTGPAIRGDHQTIAKHLALLSEKPELAKIYDQLTKLIISEF